MSLEHGGFQVFSDLDEATYSALKESIAVRGVLVPIAVDQDRKIIDGHNRARAARELGVECPEVVVEIEDHQDGVDVARLLNTVRRHLDAEQRRSVVAELRAAGHSLRAIAGVVGVDPKTVRNDLDKSGGEGSPPERTTGADGKTYPATKPKPTYSRCVACGGSKRADARMTCEGCRAKERAAAAAAAADAPDGEICKGGCGRVDPDGMAGGWCPDCWEKQGTKPERQPQPPTLRDAPQVRELDAVWKPVNALAKALREFPSVEEAGVVFSAEAMEVLDDIAKTAAKWSADWLQARKANGGLRLVGGNR